MAQVISKEQVTGKVVGCPTRTIQVKRGPRAGKDATVHSIEVDTPNGLIEVNVGFRQPYEVGESVNLSCDRTQFGLEVSKSQAGPAAPAAKASVQHVQPARVGFPVGKDTKDISIIRQNSMTHASRIVDDMVRGGIIGKPQSEEEYIEKVFDVAYQITEFSSGHREVKMAMAMMEAGEDIG
jgi:hypothetical protein